MKIVNVVEVDEVKLNDFRTHEWPPEKFELALNSKEPLDIGAGEF